MFPSKCGEGVEGENAALFAAFRGELNLAPSSRWDVILEDVQVFDLFGEMCPDLFDERAVWID